MEQETNHIGGEVVEVYRQPEPREVVEVYTRPLPGAKAAQGPAEEKPRPVKRKRQFWILIGLACVAVTAILAAALGLLFFRLTVQLPDGDYTYGYGEDYWPEESGYGEVTMPAWPTGQGGVLRVEQTHGEELTAQEIYRRVNPAVVQVRVQVGQQVAMGTGVIFSEDGYLLTNYHVVEGGSEGFVVLPDGSGYSACYVAGDPETDLAVLKVDGHGLPTVEFGESDFLTVGDPVYAIGNPLSYELWGTMTDGIVSAVEREVQVDSRSMTLIQTNAALNSGNSGGPLINQYGQVVGLNVIKMSSSRLNVEGLGFAIPSATMERVVNDLLTTGQVQPQPLLGLSVLREAQQLADGSSGLRVEEIISGGAADRAGVQVGDYALAADGCALNRSQDLLRVRRNKRLGDTMDLTLWRDGEVLTVTLELTDAVE